MAETEELKLQVTLVDNATAGLKAMRQQVQELGGGQSAQNLDRFRRQTQEAHEKGLKPFTDDLTEATKRMVPFVTGIGGIATGMLAVGYAADKALESLGEFAKEQTNIGKIAEQTGLGGAAVKMMQETFARAGVGAQAAAKDIAGFAHAMADVTRVNSDIRRKLFEGQKTGAEIEGMQSFFGDLVKFADDPTKFGNRVIEGYEQIKKNLLKRGETPERAAEGAQKFINQVFGVPDITSLVQFKEHFSAITDEQKAAQASRNAAALEFESTSNRISESWKHITDAWMNEAITSSPLMSSMKWIDAALARWAERAEKAQAELAKHPPPEGFWPKLNPFDPKNIEREKAANPELHTNDAPWQPTPDPTLRPGAPLQPGTRMPWRPGVPQRFTDMPGSKYQGFIDSLAFPDAMGQIEDRRGEGGGGASGKQRIIKAGVFEALVDFQVYAQAGGALGRPAFFAGTGGLPGFGGGGGGGGGPTLTPGFGGGGGAPHGSDVGPGTGEGAGGIGGDGGTRRRGGAPHGSDVGPGTGEGAGETPPANISGGGAAYLRQQRAAQIAQINANPQLKHNVLKMLQTEEGNVAGRTATMEALLNRTKMTGTDIEKELHSGFYGPINRGALRGGLSKADQAISEKAFEAAAGGSFVAQGRTDQGMVGDPNWRGPGRISYPGMSKSSIFNYWKGTRGGNYYSTEDSARFAEKQREGIAAADRAQIDNGMAQRVEGTGKLSVHVNAPRGTKVGAEGRGIFKKTEVTRQTQMEPAASSMASQMGD